MVVVVVSMGAASAAVVSTGEVSPVAVSTGAAFVVVVSTAVAFVMAVAAISVQCEADTRSPAADLVGGVAATGAATGAMIITDSLMMSSSSAISALRGGGAGVIRTDITVTTITRTITMAMDTAGTHTAPMDTADTVTMVGPVTDTAMAADQGIPGVRGVGDKPGQGPLKIRDEATCESSKSVRLMFGDEFGE